MLSEEEEKSQGESPEGRVQPDVPGLRGTSLTILTLVGVLKRFALFAKPLFDQLALVLVFLESSGAKTTNLAAHVLASAITWQLCAQKFLMICCSFNWLSGIRFYQECKKLKCWLLTYWDHICIISFGIIDCCKHEKNRPNIGAVSNVWLRRSGETYKTWYPIILRQTCSSLARQCKIGG